MDVPLHWTLDYIKDLLPPDSEFLNSMQTFLLSPSSPLHHLRRSATTLFTTQVLPVLAALLDQLTALLAASPGIVAGAVILVLAVLILQILSIIRRVMLFWTRLAFRLLTWAAAGLVLSMIWQRGVERSIRDAVVVGSTVGGWMVGVGQTWWREYERAQQMQAQSGYQQQGRPGYGGR